MVTELCVLGEIAVRVGDRSMNVGHARQRSVLAVLALDAGRLVPTETLIDRVWGDRPPGDARNVLSNYLARLRRALAANEDVTIQRRPGGYVLTVDPLAVDVHRFRHLVGAAAGAADDQASALLGQALQLWRGEPFAGLDNEWLDTVRTGLIAERLAAELDHTELRLRRGEHARLLPELLARAATHPFDERVAAQLMLALYRVGRQSDALRHYQELCQRLVAELGADPGVDLRQLHQRILANDPLPSPTPEAAAPVAGVVVVPRQLPAPPGVFAGRHRELARLCEVAGTTSMLTEICGAGGIGKTWLALHWAHTHAGEFPDGQLFVDLRGFSPDSAPMDPATALHGFLDALGVPADRVPAQLLARAALFRSVVAGKRMLILLDNAATAEQVTPLLPGGTTSTVLVTSRRTLTGLLARHGAHHLALDILPETDAHTLLADRLGADRITAERAATTELVRLCGGFPLALSIIACRAEAHHHLPLADLATELRDLGLTALADDDPVASLPTVLSWSIRALSPQATTLFALLGIAPGADISVPDAASLADLPPTQTRELLRELEQASLLRQRRPGRYQMHDLIRLCANDNAQRQLSSDQRTAALRRAIGLTSPHPPAVGRGWPHVTRVLDLLCAADRPIWAPTAPAWAEFRWRPGQIPA